MNYVERCLYDYRANLAEIEVLYEERNNLMSLHGHSYEINNSLGESDPVVSTVNQKFLLDGKISKLERKIKPVKKLLADLNGKSLRVRQMLGILKLKYFQHEEKDFIKRELAMSSSTLWRRTGELISLAKRYFGNS